MLFEIGVFLTHNVLSMGWNIFESVFFLTEIFAFNSDLRKSLFIKKSLFEYSSVELEFL